MASSSSASQLQHQAQVHSNEEQVQVHFNQEMQQQDQVPFNETQNEAQVHSNEMQHQAQVHFREETQQEEQVHCNETQHQVQVYFTEKQQQAQVHFTETQQKDGEGSGESAYGPSSSSACSSPRTLQKTLGPESLAIFSFMSARAPGIPGRSVQVQQRLRVALASSPLLSSPGLLLDSRERGVLFPMVHFTDEHEALRARLHQPSSLLDDKALGPEWELRQGVYREVRQMFPARSPGHEAEEGETSSFILIGFKSLDRSFSQVMVDTWKDWTGARSIYLHLPDELGLSRISFYHRETPEDLQLFMYVVLVECRCTGTPERVCRLLDFTQRLRVERMTGYISVYSPLRYAAALSALSTTVTSPTTVKHRDVTRRLLEQIYSSSPKRDQSGPKFCM